VAGDSYDVLISSAGRRVSLMQCWRRSLRALGLRGRLLTGDMSRMASAGHLADEAFIVPRCTSDEFIPFMLELCRKEGIRVIVPTIDTELPVYAEHRLAFTKLGVTIPVSSPEAIKIGYDKVSTHRWLMQKAFPTVEQASSQSALSQGFNFPAIAKPVRGSSSIGVMRVENSEELRQVSQGTDYVVQAIAPGHEYTVSTLVNREGQCVCAVPRRRLEVRHGEVSKGMTVRHEALENLASDISEALPGAYGPMNVQIFMDDTSGEMNVIEINARFGGGYPLAFEAGAYYPKWIVEELLNLESSASRDSWQDRLVMLRYDDAVFVPEAELGSVS
jgi:carbamoyl-phosphate synthase large subunit